MRLQINKYHTFVDINECILPTSCPGNNTRCVNEKGSFRCICMPGYSGEAGNCQG